MTQSPTRPTCRLSGLEAPPDHGLKSGHAVGPATSDASLSALNRLFVSAPGVTEPESLRLSLVNKPVLPY